MKNKKLIGLIMVALIIALVMTALIIKNTQANSSESNIASNDEVINEIDDTNEIQSASENITEETDIAQENIVLESDTETAPEADAIQHEVAKKLGITIENKIYTEYELEIVYMKVLNYYKNDEMDKEDLELSKSLDGTGVSQKEYDDLLGKIEKLNNHYNL